MVTMRVFCYLLIYFFTLQLNAKVSNANFSSQAPQAANSDEGFEASTNTQFAKKATEVVIGNRKMLKYLTMNVEANEKNSSLEIESKETVKKRKNKRLTKTVSLTADYSDPGHHPPRHN